jgi:hypothetical protein
MIHVVVILLILTQTTNTSTCRKYGSSSSFINCLNTHKDYFMSSINIQPSCHRDRAKFAVEKARSFRKAFNRVLDLGAGCGDVKRFLRSDMEIYIPSDIRSREFPVLECDYGRGYIPDVKESLDVIFVLGILEWMCDPYSFLQALRTYNTSVVLSYTSSDLHVSTVPLANSIRSETLENMLSKVGFLIRSRDIVQVQTGEGYFEMPNMLYYLDPIINSHKRRSFGGDFLFIKNF